MQARNPMEGCGSIAINWHEYDRLIWPMCRMTCIYTIKNVNRCLNRLLCAFIGWGAGIKFAFEIYEFTRRLQQWTGLGLLMGQVTDLAMDLAYGPSSVDFQCRLQTALNTTVNALVMCWQSSHII
ncbi:hypothetical protein V2G26_005412 [Clonostachys chloroleuca]